MVDDILLMKYMQGLCTGKEKEEINGWLEESEENRQAFREAHIIFESVLLSADPARVRIPARLRKKRPSRFARIAAMSLSAAAVLCAAVLMSVHLSRLSASRETIVAEVPAGKMMTLTLGDGTRVELNSGSRLEYPAIFYGRNRNVSFEGEARFHVTHNPQKPFTVKTFAADIEVLGTDFNVHAEKQGNIFSTSLIEGSVRVRSTADPGQSFKLEPEQTAVLQKDRLIVEDRLDPQALYWPEGLINIAGLSFGQLMDRFSKAFGVTIQIDREEIPAIDCTSGEIRISDGIDHALRVLQHVTDFTYTVDSSTGTIHIR